MDMFCSLQPCLGLVMAGAGDEMRNTLCTLAERDKRCVNNHKYLADPPGYRPVCTAGCGCAIPAH